MRLWGIFQTQIITDRINNLPLTTDSIRYDSCIVIRITVTTIVISANLEHEVHMPTRKDVRSSTSILNCLRVTYAVVWMLLEPRSSVWWWEVVDL